MPLLPMPVIGSRFGRLTVTSKPPTSLTKRGGVRHTFMCLCDCGAAKETPSDALRSGLSQSCGCLRREFSVKRHTTHGMSKTPIYSVWNMMHQRCGLPSNRAYADYGGRGIKVCEAWESFEKFYADVGDPPFPRASLDRIDNDKGYSKENCRWATWQQQGRNKRNTRLFSFRGHDLILSEWSDLTGLNLKTLTSRVYLYGYPVERALTEPVQAPTLPGRPVIFTPREVAWRV